MPLTLNDLIDPKPAASAGGLGLARYQAVMNPQAPTTGASPIERYKQIQQERPESPIERYRRMQPQTAAAVQAPERMPTGTAGVERAPGAGHPATEFAARGLAAVPSAPAASEQAKPPMPQAAHQPSGLEQFRAMQPKPREAVQAQPGGPSPADIIKAKYAGDLKAGWNVGVKSMQSLGAGAVGAIGQAVGSDSVREWGVGHMERLEREMQPWMAGRPTKLEDIKGVGDAADWVQFTVAQVAPSILESIGAAMVGGALGSVAAPGAGTAVGAVGGAAAKGAVKGALSKYLAKATSEGMLRGATREAAEQAAKRTVGAQAGAAIGMFGSSYLQGVGDVYGETLGDDKRGDLLASFALAVPYAALDSVVEMGVLGKIMKGSPGEEALKRYTRAILGTAVKEGSTEAAQEALVLLAGVKNGKEYSSEQVLSQLGNGFAAGFLAGGVMGAPAGRAQREQTGFGELVVDVLPGGEDPVNGMARPELRTALTDPSVPDPVRARAFAAVTAALEGLDPVMGAAFKDVAAEALARRTTAVPTDAFMTAMTGGRRAGEVEQDAAGADTGAAAVGQGEAPGLGGVTDPGPSALAEQVRAAREAQWAQEDAARAAGQVPGQAEEIEPDPRETAARLAAAMKPSDIAWVPEPLDSQMVEGRGGLWTREVQRSADGAWVLERAITPDGELARERVQTFEGWAQNKRAGIDAAEESARAQVRRWRVENPNTPEPKEMSDELSELRAQRRWLEVVERAGKTAPVGEEATEIQGRQVELYRKALAGERVSKVVAEAPETAWLRERFAGAEEAPTVEEIGAALREYQPDGGQADEFAPGGADRDARGIDLAGSGEPDAAELDGMGAGADRGGALPGDGAEPLGPQALAPGAQGLPTEQVEGQGAAESAELLTPERPTFVPTHVLSDGTPVEAVAGESNVYRDESGIEIEDDYAELVQEPIGAVEPTGAGARESGALAEAAAAEPGAWRGAAEPAGAGGRAVGAGEPVSGVDDAPSALTAEAAEVLKSVDEGGLPFAKTRNLERIAAENGVEVSPETTPEQIVAGLRERAGQPTRNPVESGAPNPHPPGTLAHDLEQAAREADAEAARRDGKRYKDNKNKVTFEGDGPVRDGEMSIGAINAGRKQKAIEAAQREAAGLRQLAAMPDEEALRTYSNLRRNVEKNWTPEPGKTIDDVMVHVLANRFGMQTTGPGSASAKAVTMLEARREELERGRAEFAERAANTPDAEWESLLFGESGEAPASAPDIATTWDGAKRIDRLRMLEQAGLRGAALGKTTWADLTPDQQSALAGTAAARESVSPDQPSGNSGRLAPSAAPEPTVQRGGDAKVGDIVEDGTRRWRVTEIRVPTEDQQGFVRRELVARTGEEGTWEPLQAKGKGQRVTWGNWQRFTGTGVDPEPAAPHLQATAPSEAATGSDVAGAQSVGEASVPEKGDRVVLTGKHPQAGKTGSVRDVSRMTVANLRDGVVEPTQTMYDIELDGGGSVSVDAKHVQGVQAAPRAQDAPFPAGWEVGRVREIPETKTAKPYWEATATRAAPFASVSGTGNTQEEAIQSAARQAQRKGEASSGPVDAAPAGAGQPAGAGGGVAAEGRDAAAAESFTRGDRVRYRPVLGDPEVDARVERVRRASDGTEYVDLDTGLKGIPVDHEGLSKVDAERDPAPEATPAQAQATNRPSDYGAKNRLFTADAAAKAREILKRKLGQLSSGIDPEMMQAGIILAGYHIESGARKFAEFARAMIEDLGEAAKPYLRSWYEGARYHPGFDAAEDMTPVAEMDAAVSILETESQQEPDDGRADVRAGDPQAQLGDRGDGAGDRRPARAGDDRLLAGASADDDGAVGAAGDSGGVRARDGNESVERRGAEPAGGDVLDGRGGTGRAGVVADDARGGGSRADGRKRGGGKPAAGPAAADARGDEDGAAKPVAKPETAPEPEPAPKQAEDLAARAENYHIADPSALFGGTPKRRFAKNRAAIETYRTLQEDGRAPTAEERDALAAYIGWGSFGQELFQGSWDRPLYKEGWRAENDWLREHLSESEWKAAQASIRNAHYTDPPTVQTMWALAERMGFRGGRVLEPAMAIGNFYGLMPLGLKARSQLTGIELDELSAGMAKLLYPQANIQQKPYQESQTPDGFYDLVIGNWPFDKQGPADRRYNRLAPSLHDYFFLKAVDQVRPGGLVMGITSRYSLDQVAKPVRLALAKKADLVAAFRLPSGAFEEYAGTKVVTDIIILRKREAENTEPAAAGWIESVDHPTPSGESVKVNAYFAAHPEHVLGTIDFGSGTTYGRAGLIVTRPNDLATRLQALPERVPAGAYLERQATKAARYITNHTQERTNAVTIGPDGELYVVQGEHLAALNDVEKYRLKDAKKTAQRETELKALVGLRKAYGALLDAERDGAKDTEAKRKALKAQYDAFAQAHGPINLSYGLKVLEWVRDPFHPALAGLEAERDGVWTPMAVLERPVMRRREAPERPSVRDAYVFARNQGMAIDMAGIAERAGVSEAEAAKTLLDSGAVFRVPGGGYAPSDVYLSGNVRRKLREAKAAAGQGEDMARNIEKLEAVIPPDVPYFNIEAQMGAQWIAPEYYRAFVAETVLGREDSAGVTAEWRINRWVVKVPEGADATPEALRWRDVTAYGEPLVREDGSPVLNADGLPALEVRDSGRVPLRRLLETAFNNGVMTFKGRDSDGNEYTRSEFSAAANERAGQLREAFQDWVWKAPERKVALERDYNEIMNAVAPPRFDGSFLTFDGMALARGEDPFSLRQHQSNAIWRGLVQGSGLYAHEVGTGKTLTIGGIAVESRRFGLARKPVILAHNANSASVAAEIQAMYPGAKVLYVNNLDPKRVKITLQQIANDDWDAVVLPHSLIDRMTLTKKTLMSLAQEEIALLEQEFFEAAEEDGVDVNRVNLNDPDSIKSIRSVTAKELAKARLTIITNIQKQAERASREDAITFEDLGIDMLIVDEAHLFKKPPLTTRMKMRGLQKQTSARSLALKFLSDYVKRENAGRGVHLFTGTPITNTLAETFHMQRYVMDGDMARDGIEYWDAWFNTFAAGVSDVEYTATGDYRPVTKLAGFVNVAELRRMMSPYMDVVFADEMPEFKPRETASGKTLADTLTETEREELLNGRQESPIGRPYKKIVMDVAPMSPAQAAAQRELKQLAREWESAQPKQRLDWMKSGDPHSPILVEGNAAKMGLDARLLHPHLPDHPDSKVARAVRNVLRHYKDEPQATQVVFVDKGYSDTRTVRGVRQAGFNLVKALREALEAGGIPAREIAVVAGGTTPEKKLAIAEAMNAGAIRVVIGQTETLGTGVNMQRNLRAMHHLDAPWMPGELEQRNGRGWRQGNAWNTVLEYRYITEQVDGRRWQVLAVKDRFIKAFLHADEDVRVIEGDSASDDGGGLSETLSEAVGDPRLLLRQKLKADVEKLQRKERAHTQGLVDAKEKVASIARRTPEAEQAAARLDADAERYRDARDAADAAQDQAYRDALGAYLDGLDLRLSTSEREAVVARGWGNDQTDRDLAKRVRDAVKAAEEAGRMRPERATTKPFAASLLNDTFTTREPFTDALKTLAQRMPQQGRGWQAVGDVFGFTLEAEPSTRRGEVELRLVSRTDPQRTYRLYASTPTAVTLEGELRALERRASEQRRFIRDWQADLPKLEAIAKTPFARQADLDRKQQRLSEIEADMALNPQPAPSWLRHGAPLETEVFLGGKPLVVEGHQWAHDGYFVLASDGTEAQRVPYLDLRDSNGDRLFEERAFEAPEGNASGAAPVSKGVVVPRSGREAEQDPGALAMDSEGGGQAVRFSRADGEPAAGGTLGKALSPRLQRTLRRMLARGERGAAGGLAVLSGSTSERAAAFAKATGRPPDGAAARALAEGRAQGAFDPRSGLLFVAGDLDADSAVAVLLHEATHGQRRPALDARVQALLAGEVRVPAETRAFLGRVQARMARVGESGAQGEALAYVVEAAALEGKQAGFSAIDGAFLSWVDETLGQPIGDLLRRLVAQLRAWALQLGLPMNPAVDDLLALARGDLSRAARGDVVTEVDGVRVLRGAEGRRSAADAILRAMPQRAARTLEQARRAIGAWIGRPLRNTETGLDATVSRGTLGKMTSDKAVGKSTSPEDHALAVANLDQLFRNAKLDRSHPDASGEPTIAAIHRYVAPMITPNGSVVAVKMTVKETTGPNEPNPLYTIETLDVEKPTRMAPSREGIERGIGVEDVATTPTGGLTVNVVAAIQEVKDALVARERGSRDSDMRYELPDTIEVDGVRRPTTNSEGRPIHPTEEGVRNFWRWFGDSKMVDESGRPMLLYHSTRNNPSTLHPGGKSERDFYLEMQMASASTRRNPDKLYASGPGIWLTDDKSASMATANFNTDDVVRLNKLEAQWSAFVEQNPEASKKDVPQDLRARIEEFFPNFMPSMLGRQNFKSAREDHLASEKAANIMPLYVAVRHPLKITTNQQRVDVNEKTGGIGLGLPERLSIAQRKHLIQLGYDGVDVDYPSRGLREVIAFHPNQLKSGIGNRGTFAVAEPDIRYSLADRTDRGGSPLGGGKALDEAIKTFATEPGAWSRDKWLKALPTVLGAVTLRQLADLGEGRLPGINAYNAVRQRMETRRNEMVEESGQFAEEVWQRWAGKRENKAEAAELNDFIHRTTLDQVDPDRYETLKITVQLGPGALFKRVREATQENVDELNKRARQLVRSKKLEDKGLAPYYQMAAKQLALAVRAEKRRLAKLPVLAKRWAALSDGLVFRKDDGSAYAAETDAQRAIDTRKDLQGKVLYAEQADDGWVIQEAGAKQIYRRARDLYKQRGDEMMEALIARVAESRALDAVNKRALAAKIRAEFEQTMDEKGNPRVGPYFPLQRFGRFYTAARRFPTGMARTFRKMDGGAFASESAARSAIGRRADLREVDVKPVELKDGSGWVLEELGEPGFWMYEDTTEQRRDAMRLQAEGWTSLKQGLTQEAGKQGAEAVSEGFMAQAVKQLQDRGATDEADMLYQMYLQTLNQMSIRKHFIHRKGTAGYSDNALRSFGWNMTRLAHQVSKLEYVPQLERMVTDIEEGKKERRNATPDADIRVEDAFFQELQRRHTWVVSPDNASWTNFTSALGFFWYLGVTPAAALVNLSQTPIVALPTLAARFRWGPSARALGQAAVDVMRGFNPTVVKGFMVGTPRPSQAANLSADEQAAFDAWSVSGVRDRTRAHNLAGIGDTDAFWNGPTFNKGMAIVSSLFHAGEVVNRDVTLLAGYRLARKAGQGHAAAVRVAEEMTWESHFDYSNANRARAMQGNLAKVFLMFRSYSQHVTYFMWRNLYQWTKGESKAVRAEARTKFLGLMGMTAAFAGSAGLPMFGLAFGMANVMAALFGDDDEPWDAETQWRRWLAGTFPSTVGDILDRGVANTATGLDWSTRVSLRELWFRDPNRDLDGAGMYQHIVEQVLGPIGGIVGSPFTAADMIADGHWDRAAEAMTPKFLRDALKAGRYAEEGVQTLRGDPVLESLSPYEILWTAMGMQPDALRVQWDRNNAVKRYEGEILDRRSRLMTAAALALIHGDREGLANVAPKIERFNAAQPTIPITMRSLRTSVRNRIQYSEEAEGGIAVNRRLGHLREVGAFGT